MKDGLVIISKRLDIMSLYDIASIKDNTSANCDLNKMRLWSNFRPAYLYNTITTSIP